MPSAQPMLPSRRWRRCCAKPAVTRGVSRSAGRRSPRSGSAGARRRCSPSTSASGEELTIISHGAQTADGHDPGSGQIRAGEAIVVDIFPRDRESGCYADTTRTFCVGEPPAELVEYHRLCLAALERSLAAVRPGVSGRELHEIACGVFEEAGYPTQLTKSPGEPLLEGFYHSLGHGVGLEVHEAPSLGRSGQELVAGDVVALEPGCYRPGFGGCRIEDLVLVTEDGAEVLTDLPYGLVP